MRIRTRLLAVTCLFMLGCSNAVAPPGTQTPLKRVIPLLGWNSWDGYHVRVNEQNVNENLDYFIANLKPHGYDYFVLDNGWAGQEQGLETAIDSFGRVYPHPTLFPEGFAPIIEKAHAAGVKFGVWIIRGAPRRLLDSETLIKGTSRPIRSVMNPADTCGWCNHNYGLDMTMPGAQEYYSSIVELMYELGVDFIKYDDIIPYDQTFYENFLQELQAIRAAIDSVHARTGKRILLSLSPGDGFNTANAELFKLGDMVRISGDVWDRAEDYLKIFPRWELCQTMNAGDVSFDFDMVPFGYFERGENRFDNFTIAQKESFMAQRALGASPIFLGSVLPKMDSVSLSIVANEEMLLCNQNGILGRQRLKNDSIEVWVAPNHADTTKGWLGIFSKVDRPVAGSIEFVAIGLKDGGYECLDVWKESSFVASHTIPFALDPYGVNFLRYNPH